MDIPPPPPPPPSPDDAPPPGPDLRKAAPDAPAGPPPPPPAPPGPYGNGSPYGGPGGGLPSYPQAPYGQQPPYGSQGPGPGPYGGAPGPYGGAPGPYGGGYPPPPQGWYAAERTTNGLAIASLVTAFTCIPFLGLILGLVGLRQIKRSGERGKGLAVAGVTLSGLWVVGIVVIVVLGATGALDEGNTRVQKIKVGQCFNTVGSSLSDYGGEGKRSTTVDVVSCDREHDAEAYAVFPVDAGSDGDYPGVDRISDIAGSKCAVYADDYLGGDSLADGLEIYYYMPPGDGWDRGDRSVTCFFGSTDGRMSGSVKSASHGSGIGV